MRRLKCRVSPNARHSEGVESESESDPEFGEVLRIRVQAPPADGKANREVVSVLAAHLGVKKRHIRILKGHKSKVKLVEISDD